MKSISLFCLYHFHNSHVICTIVQIQWERRIRRRIRFAFQKTQRKNTRCSRITVKWNNFNCRQSWTLFSNLRWCWWKPFSINRINMPAIMRYELVNIPNWICNAIWCRYLELLVVQELGTTNNQRTPNIFLSESFHADFCLFILFECGRKKAKCI